MPAPGGCPPRGGCGRSRAPPCPRPAPPPALTGRGCWRPALTASGPSPRGGAGAIEGPAGPRAGPGPPPRPHGGRLEARRGWRQSGAGGPGPVRRQGGRAGRGGAGAHGEPAPAVAGLSVRGRPRPPAPGGCGSCGRAQAKTWALGGRLRRSGRAELACAGVKLAANGVSPEERRRAVETVAVTAFPAPTYERSDLQSLVCATNTTQ